jgi:multiple sugar transport system permease protein
MSAINILRRAAPRNLTMHKREAIGGLLFVSPWIIGFLVWTVGPMLWSFAMTFTNWDVFNPPRFVGLDNWIRMLTQDRLFWISLRVTLLYAVATIPLGLVIGLGIALLMNTNMPGMRIWRTIYYLPILVSEAAQAVLWIYIFNPRYGVINVFLRALGIDGPSWLSSSQWLMPAFWIMSMWHVGGAMMIYLGGLQSVPSELHEAAEIDGAGVIQRFWSITLPMLSPVILYNLIVRLIGTFQVFTLAYIITDGRGTPGRAGYFYMLHLYQMGFRDFRMGYASTMAWFLFIVLVGLTVLVFKSSNAWVFYQGEMRRDKGA